MSGPGALFSDSWHLVAPLRVHLRSDVLARRQVFRGEAWFVVHDRMNHQFFRLRPEAYAFIARLDGRQTVEEAWRESVTLDPENTPGQQEVVQLVAQLAESSLIQSERAGDGLRQFAQRRRRQRAQVRGQVLNFLFVRVPLFDPDALLTRIMAVARPLFSPVGAALWVAAMLGALKLAFDDWSGLLDRGQAVLAPANLGWLYLASVGLKVWHELGHGLICKRYGGEVRTFGVMFMAFLPLPYVDVSAAYAFRERRARVLVGAGGMIFELFAAAVALAVWASTGTGVINQIAYNLVFLASVSTLLFNLNPLLRFDGYFILSDLLDTPNLGQRAARQWKWLLERFVFGMPRLMPVERTPRAITWLASYGAVSSVYKMIVLWAILLFVGDQLFGLGLGLAVFGAVLWVGGPLGKFLRYLWSDSALEMRRSRAHAIAVAGVALLVLLLGFVPLPNRFEMPGVVRADPATQLVPAVEGVLVEQLAHPGDRVAAGQPLMRLENAELLGRREGLTAAVDEAESRLRLARDASPSYVRALAQRLDAVRAQVAETEVRIAALTLRAPHAGRWAADGTEFPPGLFIPRGVSLGQIVGESKMVFSAIVAQEQAAPLFGAPIRTVEVRVRGEAGVTLDAATWHILPGDQRRLPTPALGASGGGTIAVEREERGAQTTTEPFFEVVAELPGAAPVTLRHLRSGVARFSLTWQPLAVQWWRELRQLLQKRYRL
jgi:putative peptide zinc metalloprotease protein